MTEMRFIREDEKEQLARLFNSAYRVPMETARAWAAKAGEPRTLVAPEGGRLASVINMLPFAVYMGGRAMPMGGIGGVATWADCQGQGHAGALMHASVGIMREQGYLVSSLYPFSSRYYRKFGWESCGDRMTYEDFRQSDLRRGDEFRLVRASRGPEDAPAFAAAYDEFARTRLNTMIVRPAAGWPDRLREADEANSHAYLIAEEGRPTGYFICAHLRDAEGRIRVRIHDFACCTPRAWRAMFTFLATLPNNVHAITLVAPAMPTLLDAFLEPTVRKLFGPGFMFRVIDVEKAVAARGYGELARGGFTARITDEHGPWNTGAWDFSFGDGRGAATRLPDGTDTDFDWTIQQFSQLFAGYRDPVAEAAAGNFASPDTARAALLRDVFRDRPAHLMDFF